MYLSGYLYTINDALPGYEFTSTGPKGSIKKIIRFTEITPELFTLRFGDAAADPGQVNDIIVTNNHDCAAILATLASVISHFTLQHKKAWIAAKGSTPARTRLYHMGITRYWPEIYTDFEVLGFRDDAWKPFELREQYEAFMVRRR